MTTKQFIAVVGEEMKELVELLEFGFSVKDAFAKSLEDKAITVLDALNFYTPLTLARGAFEGIKLIPDQWKYASPGDREQVKEYFAEKFDIESEDLEFLIEKTIEEGIHLYTLVSDWIEYRNQQKGGVA